VNVRLGLLSLVFVVVSAAADAGSNEVAFAATRVRLAAGGKEWPVAAVSVAGEKIRTSPLSRKPGADEVAIFRHDKGVVWTLYPDTRRYTETPLSEEDWRSELTMTDLPVARTVVGPETVDGMRCTRLRYVLETRVAGAVYRSTNAVWTSDILGLPVKTIGRNGSGMMLRSVRIEPQAAEFFEIPPGYTKADNPVETLIDFPAQTNAEAKAFAPLDSMHKPFNVKSFRQKFCLGY